MGAAIWSADPAKFLEMPATSFVRFFENHELLSVRPPVAWRVVSGGSARYLEKLVDPFRDRIRTGCAVRRIARNAESVDLLLLQQIHAHPRAASRPAPWCVRARARA